MHKSDFLQSPKKADLQRNLKSQDDSIRDQTWITIHPCLDQLSVIIASGSSKQFLYPAVSLSFNKSQQHK